jgi:ABC-2 type transport system permease protein
VPLFVLIGFLWIPFGIALMIWISKNPDATRAFGLLSVKASLMAGMANWPSYLGLLEQGTAIAGYVLFTFIVSWVFGREFTDGTLKDMLATPVSRATVLLAKFGVTLVWAFTMVVVAFLVSLVLGALLDMPDGSVETVIRGGLHLLGTALLALAVALPGALFASMGRGYLLPIGIAVLTLILANVMAFAGLGAYLPWAIPIVYAESSLQGGSLTLISTLIVLVTAVVGVGGTVMWWRTADQSK